MRHEIGLDKLMWGSDYPHREASYPYTKEHLRLTFEGMTRTRSSRWSPQRGRALRLRPRRAPSIAERVCPTKAEVFAPFPWSDVPEEAKECPGLHPENQRELVSWASRSAGTSIRVRRHARRVRQELRRARRGRRRLRAVRRRPEGRRHLGWQGRTRDRRALHRGHAAARVLHHQGRHRGVARTSSRSGASSTSTRRSPTTGPSSRKRARTDPGALAARATRRGCPRSTQGDLERDARLGADGRRARGAGAATGSRAPRTATTRSPTGGSSARSCAASPA